MDEKGTEEGDSELSFLALNNILNISEEAINGLIKEK